MVKCAPIVIAVATALSLAGCVMPGQIPLLIADAEGYMAISPCGEPITTIEVRKWVASTGPTEPYWKAQAHPEDAAKQVRLFSLSPGYSSTAVNGPLEPGAEYLVEINNIGESSGFVVGQLIAGRGKWQNDNFDVAELAAEQQKVSGMVCPRQ